MPNEETMSTERRFKKMELLLNGLAELGVANEPLVDYAYTLALEAASSPEHLKVLADAMRKKWLSDPEFPPVAVRMCKQLSDLRVEEVRFRSIVYGTVINDYRDRAALRKISRALFCNSVHFAFEFFRHFHVLDGGEEKFNRRQKIKEMRRLERQRMQKSTDESTMAGASSIKNEPTSASTSRTSLAASRLSMTNEMMHQHGAPLPLFTTLGDDDQIYMEFVDPLYDYLQILIDDSATENEMSLFHYLMFLLGPYLEKRKAIKMHHLMLAVRHKVIEAELRPSTRALFMELIELHSKNWKSQNLNATIAEMYLKFRPSAYSVGVAVNETPDENSDDEDSVI